MKTKFSAVDLGALQNFKDMCLDDIVDAVQAMEVENSFISSDCPHCGVHNTFFPALLISTERLYYAFTICPSCGSVVLFELNILKGTILGVNEINPSPKYQSNFPPEICKVSPDAIAIYEQAMSAKLIGLSHLVGMGIRKAFDFLVTDYLKFQGTKPHGTLEERIKQLNLSERPMKIFATLVRITGNCHTHPNLEATFTVEDMEKCFEAIISHLAYEIKAMDIFSRLSQEVQKKID